MELATAPTPESIYNDAFCSRINAKKWRYREIPLVSSIIYSHFKPSSIIDIGCSNGIYLNEFKKLGCRKLFGIEGTSYWAPYIDNLYGGKYLIHDIRKPLTLNRKFDLAISIEVLEHLEEPFANTAVSSISQLSDTFFITACSIGGKLHPNPQVKSYWIKKFSSQGLVFSQGETTQLQNMFRQLRKRIANMPWFKQDVMIFRRPK